MKREVDRLMGIGTVTRLDGSIVGDRNYSLIKWVDVVSDGRGGEVQEPRSIEGRITLHGDEGLTLVGQDLVLKLKDGSSPPFFFTNSSGWIAARGALL